MTADRGSAVAIGGGTGLPLVLRCLVDLGYDTTAIVTMADDGGSSGFLRREIGVLPPGDLRNCLVALAEPGSLLADVFQYRFAHGEGLVGHALGNLIIAALSDITGDFSAAIASAGRLLGARGTVLPSTLADVHLAGTDSLGRDIVGQAAVANNDAAMGRVRLTPPDPAGYGCALDAVMAADLVVLGPGSLFTSVIPNLLVSGMVQALEDTSARVVYVCNVANQRGETSGLDAADHVRALLDHGLEGILDLAVVQRTDGLRDARCAAGPAEAVQASEAVRGRIEGMGVRVMTADLVDPRNECRHDPQLLTVVLGEV